MCKTNFDTDNSLSLIRLLAALQVMTSHFISHLDLPVPKIISSIIGFYSGVPIFFAMSGFLIWFSISKSKTEKEYLIKRFWRIYPELWLAVLIEILILIFLYHKIEWKSFLLFAFGQSTIFQFWTPDSLRGYGLGTPNGSLWTIGVTVQFYLVAWPFYRFMKNNVNNTMHDIVPPPPRNVRRWILILLLAVAVSWGVRLFLDFISTHEIIVKLYGQTIVKHFWLFCLGMFIAEFRDHFLPFLKKYWYILLFLSALFYYNPVFDINLGYTFFRSSFLVSGLIGFAFCFPKLKVLLDISYGIYLYHIILLNLFIHFYGINAISAKWLYALAIIFITLLISFISTITVGNFSRKRCNEYFSHRI